MKRSWFGRRWVVQEITLARDATIYCGLKSIRWKDFTEAVALFELMADRVKKKFRTDPSHGQPPDIFGDVREFSANRLVAGHVVLLGIMTLAFSLEGAASTGWARCKCV